MNDFTSMHPYWLILSALAFALIPMLIGVCTSYLKVSIVFGMLRNGLGTQQAPSNLVVMCISLSLSIFIMGPVIEKSFSAGDVLLNVNSKLTPSISTLNNLEPVLEPWKDFMQKHSGEHELKTLAEVQKETIDKGLNTSNDTVLEQKQTFPFSVVIPAFLLSELKEAFAMGFVLLLPFLVIDLIVANILTAMGMQMLTPAMISLPLKLFFFVISDGWLLLSRSLIMSYNF